MSLRLNSEYEKLLPKMTEEEFGELKTSIQAEGQHFPIIVNENLEVLDGHHRLRACNELQIEPDFEVRKFDNKLLEKKFVIEANLRRRHLNNFQLVELAVPLLEIEKELAKKRQVKGGKNGRDLQLGLASDDPKPIFKGKATQAVAKKVGLSTRTFERGKKVIEKASEQEKQNLREGKTSISKVYSEIKTAENLLKPKAGEATNADLAVKQEAPHERHNKTELLSLLEQLLSREVFCPSCGHSMFECSQCHKTLQELLKGSRNSVK